MAKKIYSFQTKDSEMKPGVLYIDNSKPVLYFDMEVECVNVKTAYRRFYKALGQVVVDGIVGDYDLLDDLLIKPEEFDFESNSPFYGNERAGWEELGYVCAIECIDDGLWYMWLNIKRERMTF